MKRARPSEEEEEGVGLRKRLSEAVLSSTARNKEDSKIEKGKEQIRNIRDGAETSLEGNRDAADLVELCDTAWKELHTGDCFFSDSGLGLGLG